MAKRVALKTLVARSRRNMAKGTNAVVRETAIKVIRQAYKEGINAQISEGYRSAARQNALYRQGRTTGGKVVTNARAGQSWHNYGIAIDYFLTSYDGKVAIWTVNSKWRRVAAIAHSYKFEWGGVWKSFVDYPHLQMTGGLTLKDLQAGKRPNLSGKGNITVPKKPTATKWTNKGGNWTGGLLKNGHKGKQVGQLQDMLIDNYFYPDSNASNKGKDDYFGADTEDALRRFQMVNLPHEVDGRAGKNVYNKLTGKAAPKKPAKAKKWTGKTLQYGDKGADVTQLQKMLSNKHFYPNKDLKNNGVDGIYKKNTRDAVERFQRVYLSHEVDGKAGKNVYRELNK